MVSDPVENKWEYCVVSSDSRTPRAAPHQSFWKVRVTWLSLPVPTAQIVADFTLSNDDLNGRASEADLALVVIAVLGDHGWMMQNVQQQPLGALTEDALSHQRRVHFRRVKRPSRAIDDAESSISNAVAAVSEIKSFKFAG